MAADAPAAFFSYCRDDSGFALRLGEDLKAAGANVWMDQLELEVGKPWDVEIQRALTACPRTLVLLSPSSVSSPNVLDEISYALRKQKTIIPVLYRDCDIPLRLERLHQVDFRSDYIHGLKLLLPALGVDPQAVAERARLEEERKQAAEQARLEEERKQAAEKARLEEERRQAAEKARLEEERRRAAEAARLEEELKALKVWEAASRCKLRTLKCHVRFFKEVHGVMLSGDGRLAVSASRDDTLKVWDLGSGRELRILKGHSRDVAGVAFSGDGRLAVSASWDNTLKVWEVESGRELRTLEGHSDRVRGVALSGDGRLAVSASDDKTLKVWEVESGRELRTLKGHSAWVNGVALSVNGRIAVSASGFIFRRKDDTLKVWEVESGRELRTLKGHSNAVNGVALSGDGRLAVSASWDNTLKVWEVESGRELRTLKGHTNHVDGVALSGDGRRAVSASGDRTLRLWDVEGGRELASFKVGADLRCCAASSDGKTIVAGDAKGCIHYLCLDQRQQRAEPPTLEVQRESQPARSDVIELPLTAEHERVLLDRKLAAERASLEFERRLAEQAGPKEERKREKQAPLEQERQAAEQARRTEERRVTERVEKAQEQKDVSHHPKLSSWTRKDWAVPLVIVIGGITLFVSLCIWTDEMIFEAALAQAQANPLVVQRLGMPLKTSQLDSGGCATGGYWCSNWVLGSNGHANREIAVSGPKAKGTLLVVGRKRAGQWTFDTLQLKVEGNNERIDLLQSVAPGGAATSSPQPYTGNQVSSPGAGGPRNRLRLEKSINRVAGGPYLPSFGKCGAFGRVTHPLEPRRVQLFFENEVDADGDTLPVLPNSKRAPASSADELTRTFRAMSTL